MPTFMFGAKQSGWCHILALLYFTTGTHSAVEFDLTKLPINSRTNAYGLYLNVGEPSQTLFLALDTQNGAIRLFPSDSPVKEPRAQRREDHHWPSFDATYSTTLKTCVKVKTACRKAEPDEPSRRKTANIVSFECQEFKPGYVTTAPYSKYSYWSKSSLVQEKDKQVVPYDETWIAATETIPSFSEAAGKALQDVPLILADSWVPQIPRNAAGSPDGPLVLSIDDPFSHIPHFFNFTFSTAKRQTYSLSKLEAKKRTERKDVRPKEFAGTFGIGGASCQKSALLYALKSGGFEAFRLQLSNRGGSLNFLTKQEMEDLEQDQEQHSRDETLPSKRNIPFNECSESSSQKSSDCANGNRREFQEKGQKVNEPTRLLAGPDVINWGELPQTGLLQRAPHLLLPIYHPSVCGVDIGGGFSSVYLAIVSTSTRCLQLPPPLYKNWRSWIWNDDGVPKLDWVFQFALHHKSSSPIWLQAVFSKTSCVEEYGSLQMEGQSSMDGSHRAPAALVASPIIFGTDVLEQFSVYRHKNGHVGLASHLDNSLNAAAGKYDASCIPSAVCSGEQTYQVENNSCSDPACSQWTFKQLDPNTKKCVLSPWFLRILIMVIVPLLVLAEISSELLRFFVTRKARRRCTELDITQRTGHAHSE